MSTIASGKKHELVTTACQKQRDSQTPRIGYGFCFSISLMVKFPPRSQGRIPPQGSPFAAFSGTPSAAFAEQETNAAHMAIGSQNVQRPIIAFKPIVLLMARARQTNASCKECHFNRAAIYRTFNTTWSREWGPIRACNNCLPGIAGNPRRRRTRPRLAPASDPELARDTRWQRSAADRAPPQHSRGGRTHDHEGAFGGEGQGGNPGANNPLSPARRHVATQQSRSLPKRLQFQAAFGPHPAAIMGDIPNCTNVQPVVQISEVKM
jgi:hypothetical protein